MIYCRNCGHEMKDDDRFCTQCGTPIAPKEEPPKPPVCSNCGQLFNEDALFCSNCGAAKDAPKQEDAPKNPTCPNCGQEVEPGAPFCPNCGYAPAPAQEVPAYTEDMQKSKLAAGLLGIFLGWLGVHNFYLGNTSKAVIQLLLGTIGAVCCGIGPAASGIWGLIEGIMILSGSTKTDGNNIPLKD